VLNADCPQNKACLRNKCVDPCPGVCGVNAECHVYNHIPNCECISGHQGNAFHGCYLIIKVEPAPTQAFDPCHRKYTYSYLY
jgi:hypothetical protein